MHADPMGLLADLLRPRGKPPATVAEAEAALERLRAERDRANDTANELTRRRADLLLRDGSDADIVAAEASADAARLVIERLDAAEPLLLQRLAELRDVARQKLRRELLAAHEHTVRPYVEAHRAAVAAVAKVFAAYEALRAAGFAVEATTLPVPPPFLVDMAKIQQSKPDYVIHPGIDEFETKAARAHAALSGGAA